jgi:N4-gp56 family major capsid protein
MTVSISTLPPQIQQRYNAKLLSTPERNLIHNLFASPVELPDNNGFIDRQSRYDRLDLFEVPLDDAQSNPPPQQLNRVDVDCRVRVYATYIVLTRQVTITNEDPVLNSASARLGQALRETQDALQRDNLESSASVINCVGGTNGRQNIAVLKSFLMDLKLLPRNGEDNKAQAEAEMLLAA